MSKKDLTRAVNAEALQTLKDAHEVSMTSVRQLNESLQASLDELRGKLDVANATASATTATLKAKDDQIAAARAELAELTALTGKTAVVDAKGVITAWKVEAEASGELKKQVAETAKTAAKAKKIGLVEKGITEGRFTPAEKEWLNGEDVTLAQVEKMLELRPVMVAKTETKEKTPDDAAIPADFAEVAKAAGQDPAKAWAAMKADHAQGGTMRTP